jgi:hypothetical protein
MALSSSREEEVELYVALKARSFKDCSVGPVFIVFPDTYLWRSAFMLTLRRLEEWHLLVATYTDPFSRGDLIAHAYAAGAPGQGPRQHVCALVDLRAVDISRLSGSDSRRFAYTRKERLSGQPAEPVAFLLKDMGQFGMIRMHNQWLETVGLREESDTFASAEPYVVLKWLEDRTGQPGLADSLESRFDPKVSENRRSTGS